MALPGSVYVYQGEELGLWEVEDIPDELRQDPIWQRTGGADPGRDGCRVPLPWSGTSRRSASRRRTRRAEPWLPQPEEWRDLTVEAETGARTRCSSSTARPCASAGRARARRRPDDLAAAADGVLAFDRGASVALRGQPVGRPVELPAHARVLLASGPLDRRPAAAGHGRVAARARFVTLTDGWSRRPPGGPGGVRR